MYLQKKNYIYYTGLVFLAVGVAHAARVFNEWEIRVDDWVVPMWFSWIAVALALYFAFCAYKMSR